VARTWAQSWLQSGGAMQTAVVLGPAPKVAADKVLTDDRVHEANLHGEAMAARREGGGVTSR
jgi:hypothetical protein